MSDRAVLHIRARVAWWVKPYIRSVALFACTFGLQPDTDKVLRTVMRGVRLEVASAS